MTLGIASRQEFESRAKSLARSVAAFLRLALLAGRPVREAEANPVMVRDNDVVAVDALAVLKEA